ncbi:MAG: hypothetical protein Q8J89_00425 [Caulobacter sp.]|nr:hypothetical protein [Caulobacter sp.]
MTIAPDQNFDPANLLILGAGFSFNAGLPLASDFTRALLNVSKLKLDGPSANQVRFLRTFVDQVFGEGAERSANEWPELEDIFTLVDLSANTGHHLGPRYSAADLRVVRRSILVRMTRMLSQAYKRRQRAPDTAWATLELLFKGFEANKTAVLSMNWDTVFEQGLARAQNIRNFDYGCNASARRFSDGKLKGRVEDAEVLHILKPHGSVNWLYCDACRETFWVSPSQTEQVAQTLFRKRDWDIVLKGSKVTHPKILSPSCPHCGSDSLGTRFATFSYRKALDFPMHASSWQTGEAYLKTTGNWVFIGYSMPAADFEFKHLLKRVQITEEVRPHITVITGGSDADATVQRFRKFFGNVAGQRFEYTNGLDAAAMAHLEEIGVLSSNSL